MNNMLGYLRDYKRESVLAPLFKMLEATFDLFVPLVMADIVNVGIAAHDLHYILVRCGILLVLAVIGLTCSLTAQYFSAKAAVGYSTSLRHALFAHIQSLSFSEMDTLGTSTLITRMTSDINQVQSGLNLFLRLFLRSPFVVIGAMVMAFTVNARAALIFVVAIPLLSVVVFGVMVITRPLYKTAQVRLDRVLGLTRENLTGVRVVRAFDKEQDEIDRFENANDLLTKMQLHVGHLSALMSPLTYVIINIAIVALLYVGSIEINVGGMASGDVIALVNYMNQILIELVKLANLIVQVSKALACAGRVQAVLDTKPGMDFPAELRSEVPADKAGDAVRFDHVSLTYAGAGAPSLSDISFTAKRGQTIGVIGGTGSGKATITRRILDEFGGDVSVLYHDNYYKRHDDIPFPERKKLNYDHPNAFDTPLLVQHLDALRAGQAIECPIYDYTVHNRAAETTTVTPAKVIVVEGILIFAEPELRERLDIKLFVDTESIVTQYLTTVKPMHEMFVEPSKRYADIIIPEGGHNQVALDFVMERIRAYVKERD